MPDSFVIHDGILEWFQGPEWDQVVEDVFRESEEKVKVEAQSGAPWEDRTGDARAGISTRVDNTEGQVTLSLFHTVDYGKWLETIQNGRFAIIQRTLESNAKEIFGEATKRVREARKGDSL
jgi:hypothetical protein